MGYFYYGLQAHFKILSKTGQQALPQYGIYLESVNPVRARIQLESQLEKLQLCFDLSLNTLAGRPKYSTQ